MVLHKSSNPWETETRSGLVPISTHKLHVSVCGPPRKPGEPVVIYFTGGGAPAALYIKTQQSLSKFVRCIFYDRTGYGWSDRGPDAVLTAQKGAIELLDLLMNGIKVGPPYILIGHSYGGICQRAFLDLFHPAEKYIAGLVLAEAGSEILYELFETGIPPKEMFDVIDGVDEDKVLHFVERAQMTDEELATALEGIERSGRGAKAQDPHGSAKVLAMSQQYHNQAMGSQPVSVIRADFTNHFRLLYNAAVKMGLGTEEQRAVAVAFMEKAERFDDEIRASQLRLSSKNRYVQFLDQGHDLPITNWRAVVDEVKWVLANYDTSVIG